ncbi:unnamed protein product [Peronospora farinosa]|uniref:Uncharacterized protein n=1 Tax=Peronospora farinosa TaxID=134698 RepID=A0AAV0T910_9STRA|nr:unnamed protein product [Peronospora farinosa]
MLRSLHVARSSLRHSQSLRQLSFMSQCHRSSFPRQANKKNDLRKRKEKDKEPFLIKVVEPIYSLPKPRTDVIKAYFPGKVYRSTSQDVVFRAMAGTQPLRSLRY